jgi:nicotinic acid phosphoribosyltransferase
MKVARSAAIAGCGGTSNVAAAMRYGLRPVGTMAHSYVLSFDSEADAFRAFMEPFVGIVIGSRLIAAFGDDTTAVVVYEAATVPVANAPGAECVTVSEGRITRMRIIFDRLPFDGARRAAADQGG